MKSFLRGSNGGGVVGWFRKPWENSNIDLLNSHKKITFKKKKELKKASPPQQNYPSDPPPRMLFFLYTCMQKR